MPTFMMVKGRGGFHSFPASTPLGVLAGMLGVFGGVGLADDGAFFGVTKQLVAVTKSKS
jgi:hypothetical protein